MGKKVFGGDAQSDIIVQSMLRMRREVLFLVAGPITCFLRLF